MTSTESYRSILSSFTAAAEEFSTAAEHVAKLWQLGTTIWTRQLETLAWMSEHAADLQRIWDLSLRTAEDSLEAAARWAATVNAWSETAGRQVTVVNNMAHKHFDVIDGYVS